MFVVSFSFMFFPFVDPSHERAGGNLHYFERLLEEEREKMWNEMQSKYESALREIEIIAQQIQMMDLKYKELL